MGLRSWFLKHALLYDYLMRFFGRAEGKSWLIHEVIRPVAGERILDLGCGTAAILHELQDVEYLGVDNNPRYIKAAIRRHGSRGNFICADLGAYNVTNLGQFDKILLLGVLHHLPDSTIRQMCSVLPQMLKPQGILVSIDPAIEDGQHPVARVLARLDRGRYVRSSTEYVRLLEKHFTHIDKIVRHDLNQVPYTHLVLRAN